METVFLGERRLRGIKEPARIFTLEEFARKSRPSPEIDRCSSDRRSAVTL